MKKLTYNKFLEILKTNDRDNPFDITNYDKQSIIDCRLKIYSHSDFLVKFVCLDCETAVTKNIHRWDRANINFLTYCGPCLLKHNYLEKHGVTNPNKLKSVRDKIDNTNLKKYGVKNPGQRECQRRAISKANKENSLERREKYSRFYLYDNKHFDSSWELAFYIYHIDKHHKIIREPKKFSYIGKDKQIHYYIVDFKVGNKYYEIKGDHLLEYYKNGKIKSLKNNHEKFLCMKEHHVNIIDHSKIQKYLKYIRNNYSNDYLEQYRINKYEKINST